MKNAILKFLVICLMTQSYAVSSFAQMATPLDLDKLQAIVESGELSRRLAKGEITQDQFEDQYNDYMDLMESGGETALIKPSPDRVFETDADAALALNEKINSIAAATSIGELQKYAEKQVAGYGNWTFQFIYIGNNGTRKILTGRDINTPVRPASTMKLFSTNLAYEFHCFQCK